MNKISNNLDDCRTRLLDAEALLHHLHDPDNLHNLLENCSPEVTIGAMIDKAWSLVSDASGDCEAMCNARSEQEKAEFRKASAEIVGERRASQVGIPVPTPHNKHLDTLNEIHEQSLAMLNMLMLNHRHASQGEESLADSVLESYTWQLVNNMERAVKAADALSGSLQEVQS